MRKTVFTIGEFADAYIGYTAGKTWNGWKTPFFEHAEAVRVMQGFNECAEYPMQYDEIYDQFYILDEEELEIWKGKDYKTDEGIKHLYGIGAYSMTWEEDSNEAVARFIVELFWDYDLEISKQKILEKTQDLNVFRNVLVILRSDVNAETKIQRLQEELQCL